MAALAADAAASDGAPSDAAAADAGPPDAGTRDAGDASDTRAPDEDAARAGALDATAADAGAADAAAADGGAPMRAAAAPPAPSRETVVVARDQPARGLPAGRAVSAVGQRDIERRLSPSVPEAVAYEPGVFVTQANPGRASVSIRGLTGQQTLSLFDGIRINNSTYRPIGSAYLFTVDPDTVAAIELLRGGASTEFGSDALGGVILTIPRTPALTALADGRQVFVTPRLRARGATADDMLGGRAEVEAAIGRWGQGGPRVGFLGGVGVRRAGFLESAGSVENPNPNTTIGRYPLVPRFADDGRTQLGTGFKELTADARLVVDLPSRGLVTLAAYLYRQYDAPKTDRCPAPYAPYDSCLTNEEQFRHLAYAAYERSVARWMNRARVTLSFQQQNERQRLDEPMVHSVYRSLDRVHTAGVTANARTEPWRLGPRWAVAASYGTDTYFDWVTSGASLSFTNVNVHRDLSRGQYLGGSRYLYGGVFADGELAYDDRLIFRAGGRLSWFGAWVPVDPESSTQAVSRSWVPVVGHAGVEWRALQALRLLLNVDHSFRAPNLDDLTGRLQIGPGFQFENPGLAAERATTFEAGVRVRSGFLMLDAWVFEMLIDDAIVKVPRNPDDCPPNVTACSTAWSILTLQNAPGLSEMRGAEAALRVFLPGHVGLRATASYTWGEGPRLGTVPREPMVVLTEDRIPLTRVPPPNGIVELSWGRATGLGLSADVRWAATQDRLSLADYKDADIPKYGTPGYAIFDVGAAYRFRERFTARLRMENLFDSPYRRHGSSVNGAGRNILLWLDVALR